VTEEPKSILRTMAAQYGLEPAAFEAVVRKQCSPIMKGVQQELTREEFAAFLLVAKQYGLNPLTREIFAFPKRGGGVVPVVSVDGWINLVNSHPQCDGFDFVVENDADGNLVSITCNHHRKDRKHPASAIEYLSENKRDTEIWRGMPRRFLRHRAFVQSARYAYGFAGIYDEEEARVIADESMTQPVRPPVPMEVTVSAAPQIEHRPPVPMDIIEDVEPAPVLVEWTETAEVEVVS